MDNKLPENKLKKRYLTTHIKARKYLNTLINDFRQAENPDIQRYRTETYMLRTLLQFFEFEKGLEVERRLMAMEDQIAKIFTQDR